MHFNKDTEFKTITRRVIYKYSPTEAVALPHQNVHYYRTKIKNKMSEWRIMPNSHNRWPKINPEDYAIQAHTVTVNGKKTDILNALKEIKVLPHFKNSEVVIEL